MQARLGGACHTDQQSTQTLQPNLPKHHRRVTMSGNQVGVASDLAGGDHQIAIYVGEAPRLGPGVDAEPHIAAGPRLTIHKSLLGKFLAQPKAVLSPD